ncbi:MAG: FAD-binding protein [Vicinamibacterales bacterium]|nr:FAD-binding protein [Vicinamibacterales bacterium]
MSLDRHLLARLRALVGEAHVRTDEASWEEASVDGLKKHASRPAVVVCPGSAAEVSAVLRACDEARVPVVPRGAGTGYSGGAIPVAGGVVLSMARLDRVLEIDEENLLAIVEPNVLTGALQAAVETRGLFYPPDPASLDTCAIGGNVAECAGGPRAFKYGTTRRYVLGLEAVLPTGEIITTGGKTVKNVVGYDLTQLLVGSEGTLAVITKVILRLMAKPAAHLTLRVTFGDVAAAAEAVTRLVHARVVPAALELIDGECLAAVARHVGSDALAPAGTEALLLVELDGEAEVLPAEADRVDAACRACGATSVERAGDGARRDELWRVRRELSPALKQIASFKLNNDVVVPRARIPQLFDAIAGLRARSGLPIPAFGHAGDGNIHVNIMVPDPADASAVARAHEAERLLFEAVRALEGSLSGEHGIGLTKKSYLAMELGEAEIALMKRVKQAFDPRGILNPGKIFP